MENIKKIAITTVEDFLGVELQRNKISLGFDTSVHSTGIVIIRTTKSYLMVDEIYKLNVPKKVKNEDAIDLFTEQLDSFKERISRKYKIDFATIEHCFYGGNPNTLIALARHAVLVYDRFKRITNITKFLLATSARKKVKFEKSNKKNTGYKLKKDIVNFINNALNLKLKMKDQDIADACVLALAGLVEE